MIVGMVNDNMKSSGKQWIGSIQDKDEKLASLFMPVLCRKR